MKLNLKILLQSINIILLIGYTYEAASTQQAAFLNNCLGCINSGYDFCSLGAINATVSTSTGYCCNGMKGYDETCAVNYNSCTYNPQVKSQFDKFKNCVQSTQCPKQPGINGYYLSAFNTNSQYMGVSKSSDLGTCYYVILNNLDHPVYVNVTSDQPSNVAAYYSPISNFLKDEQYISPEHIKIAINQLTQLPAKTHYSIGVTVMKTGLSYSIEHQRQKIDFTQSSSLFGFRVDYYVILISSIIAFVTIL